MLRSALTVLLVPPANLAVVALLAAGATFLVPARGWPRWIGLGSTLGLVVLSLPVVAISLLASLDPGVVPAASRPPAAIVILGGDLQKVNATEKYELGPLSLERVRRGAVLHRITGLPVLVSGGVVDHSDVTVGELMRASLAEDFGIVARWTEPVSFDTWENAAQSASILRGDRIGSVFLVTHNWHMRRALLAFGRHGLEAVPVPVRRDAGPGLRGGAWAPRASAWLGSYFALHEWLGLAWYAVRG